jgi:hypothetical protein
MIVMATPAGLFLFFIFILYFKYKKEDIFDSQGPLISLGLRDDEDGDVLGMARGECVGVGFENGSNGTFIILFIIFSSPCVTLMSPFSFPLPLSFHTLDHERAIVGSQRFSKAFGVVFVQIVLVACGGVPRNSNGSLNDSGAIYELPVAVRGKAYYFIINKNVKLLIERMSGGETKKQKYGI